MSTAPMRVVIAAGGLGTRVADWAQLLPKEFQPVNGRPALLHVLDELADAGARDAALVYHPYYEPFIGWIRHALRPTATANYRTLAGLPAANGIEPMMPMRFVRQHGTYADITSVLNGAAVLPAGPLFVVFADNLYPDTNALALLREVPDNAAAVLARPFDLEHAARRGVIITAGTGQHDLMDFMVEKPELSEAERLLATYGSHRLRLLEGRFRISTELLAHLRTRAQRARTREPRLSEQLAAYTRLRPVHVITTLSPVIDLGAPSDQHLMMPSRAAA